MLSAAAAGGNTEGAAYLAIVVCLGVLFLATLINLEIRYRGGKDIDGSNSCTHPGFYQPNVRYRLG